MLENLSCGWSLAKMARGNVVAHPKTHVHAKLRVIRLPSIFVKFPNLTKFEVTYSVWLMFENLGCGWSLARNAGENVVAHRKTHAHTKLRVIWLPSFFVECRKNGQVGYGRMFNYFGSGWSLEKVAGNLCLFALYLRAHQVADDSASVNSCKNFRSVIPRSVRR